MQDSRESAGVELDKASKRYEAEKLRNSKLEAEHREKVLAMEREVGEKIPGIVSAAVEKIEKEWSKKLIRETSELKDSYEFRLDKVNKDMLDIQTVFTEREARLKLNATEEKVELDRLKQTVRQLRRQVEDYEATIEDLRRENRFLQHNFNSYEQSMVVPTTAKKSFSSRSLQQPRTSSRKNLGRHFQFDQAYQRFSEIESDEQTEAAEKIEEEKEEAKILQEQLVNQTVALIQDQLTQMKRDITSVLRVPPPENIQGFQKDSVDHFEAMANASDTNSVVHIPETNNKGVKPIGLPPRSVTFSPKALFISPLRRDSFSNNSSFYSSSMTSPWGSVLNDSVGDGRFPGDAEALLSHIKAEESINSKAKHMNLSMQNESYLSISGIPNFTPASREEKAGEFWSVKTKNRADAELNFPAFDSLADGGYHEGYWKSKYGQKY